jgi:GNAT superfamily N-acetyltransferase
MRIRRATEDDLPAIGETFVRAGTWMAEHHHPASVDFFSADPAVFFPAWRHLLATGAGFIAEDPDPVGHAIAFRREGTWFLSQLWVRPERHGQGIGSLLLDEALQWGHGSAVFSVVASPDPAAHILYMRRSMYPLWLTVEFRARGGGEPPIPLEPLEEADQAWIDALDREVYGAAHPEDHAYWRGTGMGYALRREGQPVGYVYVASRGRVGPVAAAAASDLPLLLRAGIALAPEEASFVVPSANWPALAEALRMRAQIVIPTTFLASRRIGDPGRYLPYGGAIP